MDIIFADPITTLLIFGALIAVFIVGRRLLRRGREPATVATPVAMPSSSGAAGLPSTLEYSRYGWVFEDVSALVGNRDRQFRFHVDRALKERSQGDYSAAVSTLRLLLGARQNTPEEKVALLILLGNCFLELGKTEQASGHYREAEETARFSITGI